MTDFEPFFDAFGKPVHPEPATPALLKRYAGLVPDPVIELWKRFGFGGYGRGLLWVVNPSQLEGALAEWVPGTGKSRAVAIARTAFGNIVYWRKSAFTFLDVHYGKTFAAGTDAEVLFGFYLIDAKSRRSVLQEPKFKKALKAHGALEPDEMYSYRLALAMGGDDTVANLARMKMREQLSILAQAHRG